MARVQGMTPEGIRKAIAEAIAFIKDLNVEDLNKLLAAFEDANGIFDVRLVEAQEEVKKAGEKALEAEAQAKLIIEELARYQELQDAETDRILAEVATAIEAANLASDQLPALFERLTTAEAGLDFANTEFDTLIVKQDEFRDAVAEQTAEVARLNTEFVAVNQAAADAVEKVDQSTIKVNQIGGDLELARANLDAKIKQNQEDITDAQKVADEHQNAIQTLTGNLDGLTTDYSTLSSNFSTEVENLKAVDASLLSNMDTKVGDLRATTDAQAAAISAAKVQAEKGVSDAAAAQSSIDNLEIGGRNLARRRNLASASAYQTIVDTGEKFWTGEPIYYGEKLSSGTPPTSLHSTIRIEPGETYTISMWIRGETDSGKTNANILFYDTRLLKSHASTATGAPASEWHLISGTVRNDTDTAYESVALYFYPNRNPGEKTWFTSPKLERGNKATDWTPAPEDVDASVAKAQLEAETARAEATSKSQAAQTAAEKYAKEKSEADKAAAEVVAAAEALRVAQAEAAAAKAAASSDATAKADEAERLAKLHAEAQAKSAKEAAEATAAADAKAKADAARSAAEATADTLATAAKNAAATALNTYKGLNDPKVTKAQTDASSGITKADAAQQRADKGVTDAAAALAKANEANNKLPAITSDVAAAAKAALDALEALPDIRTDISTAKQRADKGVTDAADAKSAVDNLQIGGRNLYRDSLGFRLGGTDMKIRVTESQIPGGSRIEVAEGGSWNAYKFVEKQITDPEFFNRPGAHYTLSYDIRTGPLPEGYKVRARFDTRSPAFPIYTQDYETTGDTGEKWVRLRSTMVMPQRDPQAQSLLNLGSEGGPTGVPAEGIWVEIRNFKLERGNKATDWTPAPEDTQAEIDALVTKADDLTTGLSNAATQEQYNQLNAELWGDQGSINKLQGEINDNNQEFQSWQREVNARRDIWEKASTDATTALTRFAITQSQWNDISGKATNANTKAIASHAALFEGQNKWNAVATAAIESQATLLAKQARWSDGVDKALAWQDQLNNTQSDINKTTKSVLANQAKWNSAQAIVNDSQSNINKATKLVLDNQAKWNSAQEKVNNDQSELNKAVKLVQTKQEEWNSGVSKALAAHDELFKTTSSTFKAVKEVNTNQSKWNKVVSDLITTNKNVTSANKTAIEGLNRVLGLRSSSSNVVPMVPGGVQTGGTDIAPIFTPTPAWMTKGTRVTVTDIPGITSIDAIQQTRQATHQFEPYYSEIDPTIEYKYSYWAKANMTGTRIYIELRSGESTAFPIESNTQDNHSSSGQYLAGNVLLAAGWKQYTGTIRFKPDVRTIYFKAIYYNHPNGVAGTQTIADIQIYPNIPSQADVNKALTDSDAAQNTLLKKQEEWNDAASRSIATVESLWGKTENEVGELNTLTEELGQKITKQGEDFAENVSEMFTNIPRIAYAEDGQNVSSSATDGFIKITRYKSGTQTTRTDVEAVGKWVGTIIVEGDHGQSGGVNQTFLNYTPIRKKFDVLSGTRLFRMWRNTNVDHIGAIKVTYFVKPGQVVPIYPSGGESYPDQDRWKVLFSKAAPETTDYNILLNVTWAATTYNDQYGVRIRVGSNTVAEIKKDRVGPLLPGQGGMRAMSINKSQVRVPSGTTIYLEAYSNAGGSTQRRISKWSGQMSYITSGRG